METILFLEVSGSKSSANCSPWTFCVVETFYPQKMGDLESLLFLEDMFQEFGRIDGYKQGQKEGELQGRVLGLQKGFEFAKEVGFYLGFGSVWLEKVQKNPGEYPTRLPNQLQQFVELAKSFKVENDLNEDPMGLMRSLRGKYRALQSLTKTNESYNPNKSDLHY
jgi:hypothetical protein